MATSTADPFDAATEAGERTGILWGKLDVSAQFVVLVKGSRGVVYDPNIHSQDERRTELHILVNPLDQTKLTKMVERKMLAESREWNGIVWPSARGLGLSNARELHGKWAKVELVKTGRKWTTKDGEEVENTTFKFLALYASETECVKAFYVDRKANPVEESEPVEAHSPQTDERATSAQFLPVLVKQAGGDRAKLAQMIASMSPLNKYFTVDSPEVLELLKVTA